MLLLADLRPGIKAMSREWRIIASNVKAGRQFPAHLRPIGLRRSVGNWATSKRTQPFGRRHIDIVKSKYTTNAPIGQSLSQVAQCLSQPRAKASPPITIKPVRPDRAYQRPLATAGETVGIGYASSATAVACLTSENSVNDGGSVSYHPNTAPLLPNALARQGIDNVTSKLARIPEAEAANARLHCLAPADALI